MIKAIPEFNEDVICSRSGDDIYTNIPQRIIYHSPDGFEWGYGGSGPADFALNILSVFIGQEKAFRYYQDFKWKFIASLPFEGGVILREDIISWITENIKTEEWEEEDCYE